MTLYRDIISKALSLAWKFRFLWVFAFLAALAGGNGGEYELAFSGTDSLYGQSSALGFLRAFYVDGTLAHMLTNTRAFFAAHPVQSVLIVIFALVVILLAIWLIIAAQAGLIWAIARVQGKGSKPTIGETFSNGLQNFSPILWINVATKVIVFLGLLATAVPFGMLYIRSGVLLYNTLYILSVFVLLIPVTIILSFIVKYAATYVILQKQSWWVALKNGWRLFTKNWLVSLEVALVLFIINLVTSLVLTFLLFLLGLPTNPAGLVVFFVILTLYGVFISTFQYSAWVLLFLQLERGEVRSGLNRWADTLKDRRSGVAPVTKDIAS